MCSSNRCPLSLYYRFLKVYKHFYLCMRTPERSCHIEDVGLLWGFSDLPNAKQITIAMFRALDASLYTDYLYGSNRTIPRLGVSSFQRPIDTTICRSI
jgi:hypothetical protein